MKAGVVGVGRMGLNHIKAYLSLGYSISWLVDPNINAVIDNNPWIRSLNCFCATDVNLLSSSQSVDICSVSTLCTERAAVANFLCRKKLTFKLLLEKPIGSSLPDEITLYNLAASSNIELSVNHPTRYMQSIS